MVEGKGKFREIVDRIGTRIAPSEEMKETTGIDGTNAAGHEYHYTTAMTTGRSGAAVVYAHSLTWLDAKDTVVEVTFMGTPTTLSLIWQSQERRAMNGAARSILLSVE